MATGPRLHIIVPALDEEAALPLVLPELLDCLAADPSIGAYEVLVVDNGSRDRTAAVAAAAGARVVREPRRGYGAACLAGLAALKRGDADDVVAFFDADGSHDPAELPNLLAPIRAGAAELVLGSRSLGSAEVGALAPHAAFGNALAVRLIAWATGHRYTDLGPFRAIELAALERLGMQDRDFGWNIEMQVRAARAGLATCEVPVRWRRRRAGQSKISGRIWPSARAGAKILWTVMKHAA
ncbi:MAG: glycosyltransferase family 2 protein [Longimicrobiales bacterium]